MPKMKPDEFDGSVVTSDDENVVIARYRLSSDGACIIQAECLGRLADGSAGIAVTGKAAFLIVDGIPSILAASAQTYAAATTGFETAAVTIVKSSDDLYAEVKVLGVDTFEINWNCYGYALYNDLD